MKPITFVIGLFAGSPGRARTYNNSVNSRVLCHWATEEYWVGVKKDVLRLFLRKIPGVISETLFSSRISAAVLFSPYVCSAFLQNTCSCLLFPLPAASILSWMDTRKRTYSALFLEKGSGGVLLSRAVSSQVPSALRGLTSVFGMGTGGTLSPLPPEFSIKLSTFRLTPWKLHSEKLTSIWVPCLLFSSKPLRSSPRPISISKLIHYCIYTADLSTLSSSRGLTCSRSGNLFLQVGFTLRCLQRLSRPHFASQLCLWQDNCCTRGASIPVLSY